ncbi:MAG: permease-like cell division protein FtsX [Thermodesulfobacteriota bacterium]|nr:permease-like cell division protein FtsX [Thermodesulfobacteriota bacterium]
MISFLCYAMRRALRNMKGNLFPNLTTIGIIGISLLILSTFSLIAFNLTSLLKIWEDKIEVIAYLKRGTSLNEVEGLLKKIRQIDGVEGVNYVSPFDAMAFMETRLGRQKTLLEGIQPAILPSSIEIRLKKDYWGQTKIDEVVSDLKRVSQIEEVQYGQEWIETFSVLVHLVRLTQWVLGGLLLAAIIFIISNTLQLTISSRREEIEVMHMAGASPAFIQVPFYMEGLIQGLLGAGMAMGLLFLLYKIIFLTITPLMKGWMTGIPILFLPWETMAWILSGGMVLGLFGSFVASMRFLKYRG